MELFEFQKEVLEKTKNRNHVAYYLEMGLGKTFVGSEKMMQIGNRVNLIICQKSKINDWIEHFTEYYWKTSDKKIGIYNLTDKNDYKEFLDLVYTSEFDIYIAVINYELAFRRPELLRLNQFTLMLDESSMIQNELAKRTKFILGLNYQNVILLSGTPVGGKYEHLWSQCRLLGWYISKKDFWDRYIKTRLIDVNGFSLPIVVGYYNIRELKDNLRDHGAVFLKSNEVLDLPEQIHIKQYVEPTKEYKSFKKNSIIEMDDELLIGDNILKKLLYERQLCGMYNQNKLDALKELMESTTNRLIIFYNFTKEKDLIVDICKKLNKSYSILNGEIKDLKAYEDNEDSVTIVQYQAGAMGLNLQKANKIIYFTLPLSSELFEQSKKRIHRIGQNDSCFYYYLLTKGTVEESIYKTLLKRQDYTNELYRKESD